jgi:eukaryotic-like serine/threonine-protein kinase
MTQEPQHGDHEERLAEAVASYLEARGQGQNPAPSEFAARYPECRRELTAFIEADRRLHNLFSPFEVTTREYRSTAESQEVTAEAVRAGLAAERRQSEAEVREGLRRNLRAVALSLAVGIGIARGVGLAFAYPRLLADPLSAFRQPPCYGNAALVLCLEVLAVVLLAPRRPLSLPRLRALEWLVFAPPALAVAWDGTLDLAALAPALGEHSALTVAYARSLPWVLFMVGYSVLVPNTWRRCAAVVGLFALLALLPDLAVLLGHETAAGPLLVYLANKVFWLGLAAVIVVYGAWLWEARGEEAAAALRLGHYLLQRRLDGGGMGEVYLAEHVLLRRQCALKVMRPKHLGEAKALRRFEREIRETARLTHPNIVQVYDCGFTGTTCYYVMEYLPGLNLKELVEESGPMPPARAVYLLRQLCAALREAHGMGLIHRDIKPTNVLVCEKRGGLYDVAKLLDFGLVRPPDLGPERSDLTADHAVGTAAYMAPEQARGEKVDGRADLYALGGTAYFLLTGRPPFEGRSGVEVLAAHQHKDPTPLTVHRPEVPPELDRVVRRCLEKEAGKRFPDAEAVAQALTAALKESGILPWDDEQAARWWRGWPRPPRAAESSRP